MRIICYPCIKACDNFIQRNVVNLCTAVLIIIYNTSIIVINNKIIKNVAKIKIIQCLILINV
jgi:hypothetical protein